VDSVSGTPTFWRMLIGRITDEETQRLSIKQITLGGEASTADLLERLRSRFPSAAITQVYATTEAGTCFAVKDGMPGFPASFLDRPVGNVELRIIDGELYVRSAACHKKAPCCVRPLPGRAGTRRVDRERARGRVNGWRSFRSAPLLVL